jgi:hypothetical protein
MAVITLNGRTLKMQSNAILNRDFYVGLIEPDHGELWFFSIGDF